MTTKSVIQIENLEGATLFKLFDTLNRRLDELAPASTDNGPDTFMTRQEVADLYKITIPTTYAWERVGIFKPYKIANKTRFLRGEVIAAATSVKKKGGSHE